VGIRLEVTHGYVKTYEVIVEDMSEANDLWTALVRAVPEKAGGCVMSRHDLPPTWYAWPGQDCRGTESYTSDIVMHTRRKTSRG
jgi:hypothetical protein